MDFIQNLFADRIGGKDFGENKETFKFEKIKQAKRKAIKNNPGKEMIDLGVGEPDTRADDRIIEELYIQAQKWENRGYADNGILEFQSAAVSYMRNVYQVDGLVPDKNILHMIGSKAAMALIPQAFINQGDVTLMTVPGYPILGTKTKWLGGEVFPLPLMEDNEFLPDLKAIPEEILNRAKLLYINYPNNPTGMTATKEFFIEVVEFAKKNHIIVIQDASYAALTFYGQRPVSFLSVPSAIDVGVEVHSLSKAFNMTGWRLAFVAGNEKIIDALKTVKDNNDSGQFRAIQYAGVYALQHPEITDKTCEKYKRRHKKLSSALTEIGFHVKPPKATFYEYVKIPKGTEEGLIFESAEQFSDYLIKSAMISTVPWDDAGHYVRFSVTFISENDREEDRVIEEVKSRLKACRFVF